MCHRACSGETLLTRCSDSKGQSVSRPGWSTAAGTPQSSLQGKRRKCRDVQTQKMLFLGQESGQGVAREPGLQPC